MFQLVVGSGLGSSTGACIGQVSSPGLTAITHRSPPAVRNAHRLRPARLYRGPGWPASGPVIQTSPLTVPMMAPTNGRLRTVSSRVASQEIAWGGRSRSKA